MSQDTQTYDYVVVGGGSSGAIVAARLSERTGTSVALLEAGPKDTNPYIRVPAGFMKIIFDPGMIWGYQTEPGPGIDGRVLPVLQGRVLGGSASINGMVWVRGQREDFDGWAARGNPGWSYSDVLPLFRRLENRIGGGDSQYRGSHGRLPISDLRWKNDLVDAFGQAAQDIGIPVAEDYNGEDQTGVFTYQYNIDRGTRYSSARAYLRDAGKRTNLDVLTETVVTGLELAGRRATGVRVKSGGGERVIKARREVILCAGAVNSPRLLQLSGIGPSAVLSQAGVPVVHELAGVGENYMDHFTPRLTYRAKNATSLNMLAKPPRLWAEVLKWALDKPSILGMGVIQGGAFWKTREDLDRPNFVITFTPGTFKLGFLGRLDDFPGMTTGVWQLRPESRGHIRIRSADPDQHPLIQPNFLTHERDQETVVEALRIARRLMDQPAIKALTVEETMPGPGAQSDAELLAYSRSQGLCGYHVSGTARMGQSSDPGAVVGADLKVHGIERLRIADASIMPEIVSGNTNATTMMIAEKAAELILSGH